MNTKLAAKATGLPVVVLVSLVSIGALLELVVPPLWKAATQEGTWIHLIAAVYLTVVHIVAWLERRDRGKNPDSD